MKYSKHILIVFIFLAGLFGASVQAQDSRTTGQGAVAVADMSDGEVRKLDKGNKKITIKHGEIKNLDMPSMTMVFQVSDPALLERVKTGDKVKFVAVKLDGAFVVTNIQVSR